MASVDPDRSADCHASGAVPTAAFFIREGQDMTFCAHHITTHRARLEAERWEMIPVDHTAGRGTGTESTPAHFALGTP
jgi:hypothetical protein